MNIIIFIILILSLVTQALVIYLLLTLKTVMTLVEMNMKNIQNNMISIDRNLKAIEDNAKRITINEDKLKNSK